MSDYARRQKEREIAAESIPHVIRDIHPIIPLLLLNGGVVFGGIIREVIKSMYRKWNPDKAIVDYVKDYLDETGDIDVYVQMVEEDGYEPEKTFDLLASIFGVDNLQGASNAYDFDRWRCGWKIGIKSEFIYHFIANIDGIKFDISVTKHPDRLLGLVSRFSMENLKLDANGLDVCFESIHSIDSIIKHIGKAELVVVHPSSPGVHNPGKFLHRTLTYCEQGWTLSIRDANELAPHVIEALTYPRAVAINFRDSKVYQLLKKCLYPVNDYGGLIWGAINEPKDMLTIRTMPHLRSIAEFHNDTKWVDEIEKPAFHLWELAPVKDEEPETWPPAGIEEFESLDKAVRAANRVTDLKLVPAVLETLDSIRAKERPKWQNIQVWWFNNLMVRCTDTEFVEAYFEYILDGITDPVNQRLVIMHLVIADTKYKKYTPLHKFLIMFHRRYSFILQYIWKRFGFMSVPLIGMPKYDGPYYDGQIPQSLRDRWYKDYWCTRLVRDFGFPESVQIGENILTIGMFYDILSKVTPDAVSQEYNYRKICRHHHHDNNFYPQFREF